MCSLLRFFDSFVRFIKIKKKLCVAHVCSKQHPRAMITRIFIDGTVWASSCTHDLLAFASRTAPIQQRLLSDYAFVRSTSSLSERSGRRVEPPAERSLVCDTVTPTKTAVDDRDAIKLCISVAQGGVCRCCVVSPPINAISSHVVSNSNQGTIQGTA